MMAWHLGLLCLAFAPPAEAQVITTVAGGDVAPLLSGVSAVTAPLRGAYAVAADLAGNVYFADQVDNIVARVSADGIVTVIAGNGLRGFSGDGGPATSASLNYPNGLAFD